MKAVNKKSLLVIAIALVLSLSVGLTLAYFSDYNAAKGGTGIALGGKTELVDEYNDDEKTVTIKNTGEVDVIARVAVYAPVVGSQTVSVAGENWEKVGEGDSAYWYYTQVIKAGESSKPLKVDTKYLKSDADLGDVAQIIVTHESTQAVKDADGKYVVPKGWADKVNN